MKMWARLGAQVVIALTLISPYYANKVAPSGGLTSGWRLYPSDGPAKDDANEVALRDLAQSEDVFVQPCRDAEQADYLENKMSGRYLNIEIISWGVS